MSANINFTCTKAILHMINGAQNNEQLDLKSLRAWAHTAYDELSYSETMCNDKDDVIEQETKYISSLKETVDRLDEEVKRLGRKIKQTESENDDIAKRNDALLHTIDARIDEVMRMIDVIVSIGLTHPQKAGALMVAKALLIDIQSKYIWNGYSSGMSNDIPF